MNRLVSFQSSAFNTTQDEDDFINPGNYGNDVIAWFVEELRQKNIEVEEEPSQEDFGWYGTFKLYECDYNFIVGYRPDEPDGTWIGWIERVTGILGHMLGKQNKDISQQALDVVHDILSNSPKIRNVRWHEKVAFESGDEESASELP